MSWSKINLTPGVVKDITQYGASGTWWDSNLVRFRNGHPERWGGWVRYLPTFILDGVCRSLKRWSLLNGYIYMGLGTNRRFYVASDDQITDVTPILNTSHLTNPFATTNGSQIVTVNDTGVGMIVNKIIEISGATAVGGLTLNGEYVVSGYINDNQYQITAASKATSTATGGGSVQIDYLFYCGTRDQIYGGGYGAGAYSEDVYGGSSPGGSGGGDYGNSMGSWSQDNWGEDLITCAFDGPIFYWDATYPTNRMINIRNLPGADGYAPSFARFTVISHRDRILLAFGVGEEFEGSTYAPMTVRWCDQENIYNWNEADPNGAAGSLPLSRGSRFLAVCPTQTEILAWSDTSLYSLQFVGSPAVYVANIISEKSDIAGMNAFTVYGTTVYWLGRSGFYVYDGRVTKMSSTVWAYVSDNINWEQGTKIFCGTCRSCDEICWFYPSKTSLENDSYVAMNAMTGEWTVGMLNRTAWMDMDFQYPPFATGSGGMMYYHETGLDDGSTNPPTPLNAYIESAPYELSSSDAGGFNPGDRFAFIRRILPDVMFMDEDGANTPMMNMVIKTMDKPGTGVLPGSSSQVTETAMMPIEMFTEDLHVRLRGRAVIVRFESNTLGSMWRVGMPRFDMRTDGQR